MEQVSEITIGYKNSFPIKNSTKIISSEIAAKLIYDSWDKKTLELNESFKVLLLNNSNTIKHICTISTGGITGTVVDIRLLFAIALKTLSTAIIITHNHPSGNLNPSDSDKLLTQKIIKAGELLDIKVLDHIIITPDGKYFSFKDEVLL